MASLYGYALDAFRVLVPLPQNRLPREGPYVWFYALTLAMLVAMAGMARRQGTWAMRLALFPFAMAATLKFVFGFVSKEDAFNRLLGTWGLQYCIKLIDYAFSPEPKLKLSEVQSGKKDGAKDMSFLSPWERLGFSTFFFIYDGFELLHVIRGFDWQFGVEIGIRKPRNWAPTSSRVSFVLKTLLSIFTYFLSCDVAQTIIHAAPLCGEALCGAQGRSMFSFGGDNLVARYAISTLLHFMSGILVIYGFEVINSVLSIFVVFFSGSDPSDWPPLFDDPWISTSLHDLWGKRWHQLFRRSVLLVGGHPFATIVNWFTPAGKLGSSASDDGAKVKRSPLHPAAVAMGAFLASGLLHTWDSYAQRNGRMPGALTIAFFAAQGVALAVEREWKRMTGKPVGGFWGWLWVCFWMVIVAQPLVDEWHQLGFLDSSYILPEQSPTQLFIIPFLHQYFPTLLSRSIFAIS
ncbi:hypothetical protein DL93DRAFT_2227042 [Clavulina sp. PMI_390]|nr:hypothetical protein DL93DRAFT_2227042 [Clavulina sp. PMI_390]